MQYISENTDKYVMLWIVASLDGPGDVSLKFPFPDFCVLWWMVVGYFKCFFNELSTVYGLEWNNSRFEFPVDVIDTFLGIKPMYIHILSIQYTFL